MRLLIVEDDPVLGPALKGFLHTQHYHCQLLTRGDQVVPYLQQQAVDLLVLDWNLPGMTGLAALTALRAQHIATPVLILTARDALEDRVAGLDAGADDYLSKPFELSELAARLRALVRRLPTHHQRPLVVGGLCLYSQQKELLYHTHPVNVSVREFTLLELLMQRAGKLVTKQQIMQHLAGDQIDVSDNAVEVYIYRLRKRLEHTAIRIHTKRGFGYILDHDESA